MELPQYCCYSQSVVLARESPKPCLWSPPSFFQLPSAGPRWLPISPGIGLGPVHLSQVCKAILAFFTFCARSSRPRDHLSSYEQKGGPLIFIFPLWSPLFVPPRALPVCPSLKKDPLPVTANPDSCGLQPWTLSTDYIPYHKHYKSLHIDFNWSLS